MALSAGTVYQYMTGRQVLHIISDLTRKQRPVIVTTDRCGPREALDLHDARTSSLKKLAVYQQACHSYATGTMMYFAGFPVSHESAAKQSAAVAVMLKDFAKHGVRPLVIAEPTDYDGSTNVDFAQIAAGTYNQWLDEYFANLKAAGITDRQMGIWNPFPEANLPYWNNNLSSYFAPNINLYISYLRKYFPQAETSIMLNSATYETTDFEWQSGDYNSLLPYIKGITTGSINYAGLQGLPWIPPAGGNGPILNAADYLNPTLISEMADYLGTKKIWLNTGSFSRKYALDPARSAGITTEQRRAVLATVNEQVLVLQRKGYSVSVNMFAEDKSNASEETNWSYWTSDKPFNSPYTPLLTNFISRLNDEKVEFWLFDK